MKLRPKQETRRIKELIGDENRRLYGRKTGDGIVYKHPAKTATLIALAVMFLSSWDMQRYEQTGQLPRPHAEVKAPWEFAPQVLEPWVRKPNAETRRKEARVGVQRVVNTIKNPKPVVPDMDDLRPIKEDKNWVRNSDKYRRHQMKLRHYIDTGEWKDFPKEKVSKVPKVI